jgi:hypothetical protein
MRMEIVIAGPYEGRSYGHAALRVVTPAGDRTYDFGRYGETFGEFGARGEGILRVWSSFIAYLWEESKTGRTIHSYVYAIGAHQAQSLERHYARLIAPAARRIGAGKPAGMAEYKLPRNYHGVTNNCTTMVLAGVTLALPQLLYRPGRYNTGRGLSAREKAGARFASGGNWPREIFMPADVQRMLEANPYRAPDRIDTYETGSRRFEFAPARWWRLPAYFCFGTLPIR